MKKIRRTLALGTLPFALATLGCAIDSTGEFDPDLSGHEQEVVFGSPAGSGDIGATVAISIFSGGAICTGTLIAPQLVVTAAHCTCADNPAVCNTPAAPSTIRVLIGSTDAMAGTSVGVTKVLRHPGFPGSGEDWDNIHAASEHDIGILTLERPVTEIPWATVPTPAQFDLDITAPDPVCAVGYGRNRTDSQASGTLYVAPIPYDDRSDLEFYAGARSGQGMDPSTCHGDSGGPIYYHVDGSARVIGVTSRGRQSMFVCGDGAIYTFIPGYLDWITANSDGHFPPTAAPTGFGIAQCGGSATPPPPPPGGTGGVTGTGDNASTGGTDAGVATGGTQAGVGGTATGGTNPNAAGGTPGEEDPGDKRYKSSDDGGCSCSQGPKEKTGSTALTLLSLAALALISQRRRSRRINML